MDEPTGTKVAIILSGASCSLQPIATLMPVWAPASDVNRLIAARIRKVQPDVNLMLFNIDFGLPPEDEFLCWLPSVDQQHGAGTESPWTALEVYGIDATERIKSVLRKKYGVDSITRTATGFSASRPYVSDHTASES